MNKKGLLLALVSLMLGSAAQAAHTSAGCGLGTILFDGKTKKVHLILAATTNGTFGNQTFGISSETLGCTSDGVVKADKKLDAFAEANFERLSKDAAIGGGEHLGALASLMGVKGDAEKKAFFAKLQSKHEALFSGDSASLVTGLRTL